MGATFLVWYEMGQVPFEPKWRLSLCAGSANQDRLKWKDQAIYRLRQGGAKVWKMDEYFQLKLMSNVELSSIWMAMYDGADYSWASTSRLGTSEYLET